MDYKLVVAARDPGLEDNVLWSWAGFASRPEAEQHQASREVQQRLDQYRAKGVDAYATVVPTGATNRDARDVVVLARALEEAQSAFRRLRASGKVGAKEDFPDAVRRWSTCAAARTAGLEETVREWFRSGAA